MVGGQKKRGDFMTIFPSDTKIWVGSWAPAASPSQWLQTSKPVLERISGSKNQTTFNLYTLCHLISARMDVKKHKPSEK